MQALTRKETITRYEKDGEWYVSVRTGDVVRNIVAGPDEDCADAVAQLEWDKICGGTNERS